MYSQEQIEQILRDTGDKELIKWANLMKKVRTRVKYGKITIITRSGTIDRIEQQIEYDDCSSGL